MKKQRFQKIFSVAVGIGIIVAALCLMGACGYLFLFHGGFTRETVAAVFSLISLPVYLAMGLVVLGLLLDLLLPQKQERPRVSRQAPERSKKPAQRNNRTLRYGLLALAVLLVVCGFLAGGAADVLTKAINICTECIGLG